jgi:hypothetical protein
MFGLFCVSPRYCSSTDALIGTSYKLLAGSSFPTELFFLKWAKEGEDPDYWEWAAEDGVALMVLETTSLNPVWPDYLKPLDKKLAEIGNEDIPF